MEFTQNDAFPVVKLPSEACLQLPEGEETQDLLTLAWEGRLAAALWEDPAQAGRLEALEAALGPRLLVSEVWRDLLPRAGILIPAALSGGTLAQRLEEAVQAAPGRCWLHLRPMAMRFPLPCPTGCGAPLPEAALAAQLGDKTTFFSPELCCRYAYDLKNGPGIILYDTEETLAQKLEMARDAGFMGAVVQDAVFNLAATPDDTHPSGGR